MEIKNFKMINKQALKSVFTMIIPEWGEIEIDCAYFEKENGSWWFNFGAKEYTNKEGMRKTYNQVRWPQAVKDKLTATLKEKVQAFTATPEPMQYEPQGELPF